MGARVRWTAFFVLAACHAGAEPVPAACDALLACCDEITDAESCDAAYEAALELDDAGDACGNALTSIQITGVCDGGADPGAGAGQGPSVSGPSECQALESCCRQMASPAECLLFVVEHERAGDGASACRDLRMSFVGAGVCEPSESDDLACSDGVDNDGNGYLDCRDFACSRNPAITVCVGKVENDDALCSDGVDNDANGFVDCEDFGCSMTDTVTVC